MEAIDRDELLREVERRAEVVDPAVHLIGVCQVPAVDEAVAPRIAETDDASAGDKRGEKLVPFLAVGRFAELAHDLLEGVRDRRKIVEQTRPVGVHSEVERLVVQELWRPLDRVNLGNLGRDDQARNRKQFLVADLAIADHFRRPIRIAQTGIAAGVFARHFAESIDDDVVFANEQVVQKAQSDRPVVRKGDGLLASPFRPDCIALARCILQAHRPEHRQIAEAPAFAVPTPTRQHLQLGGIGGVAPHALQ